jgi:hypothetical protein
MTQPETQQPQPRTVTLTMDKDAVPVVGNRGDQWELSVKLFGSQFAGPLWIDRSWADKQPTANEKYTCVLSVKGMKGEKKDGTARDGNADWDWNWKIDRWDIGSNGQAPGDATPAPTGQVKDNAPAPTPYATQKRRVPDDVPPPWEEQPMKPDHPSKRRSIERQAALKAAIEHRNDVIGIDIEELLSYAETFYDWISEEAPGSAAEPVDSDYVDTEPEIVGDGPTYDQDGNPVTEDALFPDEDPETIDTIEQFRAMMDKWGVTGEQLNGYLGGKGIDQWLDGKLRTVNAAYLAVKQRHGV